jgi:excisionase family DNA binding protein
MLVWPSVADLERVDAAELPSMLALLSALTATATARLLTAPSRPIAAATSTETGDRLLDAKTVADRLSVPVGYVYELTRRGILPCHRLGKKYVRVSERALAGFLEQNAEGPRQRTRRRAG